jgi:hypothetical protein
MGNHPDAAPLRGAYADAPSPSSTERSMVANELMNLGAVDLSAPMAVPA